MGDRPAALPRPIRHYYGCTVRSSLEPVSVVMTAFIRRHPLASYFALAFAISWGGVLMVIMPGSIPAPPDEAERRFGLVYLAMLLGPSVAGILLTSVVAGRAGRRRYRDRLLKWRVGPQWYAAALLTAPVAVALTIILYAMASRELTPAFVAGGHDVSGPLRAGGQATFVLLSLLVGAGAGLFEELGWTGYALPAMRRRYGELRSALMLGVAWGAWHFLAVLWGSADAFGDVPIPLYMAVAMFATLPPYRILMTEVHERTGSLLIAILMHASLTSSLLILGPTLTGRELIGYDLVLGAVLWTAVAASRVWMTQTGATSREVAAPSH